MTSVASFLASPSGVGVVLTLTLAVSVIILARAH